MRPGCRPRAAVVTPAHSPEPSQIASFKGFSLSKAPFANLEMKEMDRCRVRSLPVPSPAHGRGAPARTQPHIRVSWGAACLPAHSLARNC